jgi:predicted ATP-grasp superfamily ATP-dependent carboligase
MIEKIDKIQRLLVVENAYPDMKTAIVNIKALNLLADLKAEIEQLILSGVSNQRELLQWCYNYINKQKNSDERTAIIKELKNNGAL